MTLELPAATWKAEPFKEFQDCNTLIYNGLGQQHYNYEMIGRQVAVDIAVSENMSLRADSKEGLQWIQSLGRHDG